MTLPAFGTLCPVRESILRGEELVTVIDLSLLSPGRGGAQPKGMRARPDALTAVHSDATAFFDMTYPTGEVVEVLKALAHRLHKPESVPGTILLSGRFGQGKSHAMAAAHHALTDRAAAARWATRWKLDLPSIETTPIVVTRSFIDKTANNLWEAFFEAIGRPELSGSVTTFPDGETIEAALPEQPVVVIWDELERWYAAVPPARQASNLNFLQAISEVTMRTGRITVVTSVLGEKAEPAETLRRVRPMELGFHEARDRERVVLFRLFEEHDRSAPEIASVVDEYIDCYREAGLADMDRYRHRMLETYPFSPELMDMLTSKVPLAGGFQNTRGTLRFLADLVRCGHDVRPILSSQDMPLGKGPIRDQLATLDQRRSGGEVVRRATGDNYNAVPDDLPHKDELFSALLFYSIGDPTLPGATDHELLLAVLDPGENVNRIRDSLHQLTHYAFNLHQDDGRYVFKTRENPRARINAMAGSPQVKRDACRDIITATLASVWGAGSAAVMLRDDWDAARQALSRLGRLRPKYLLSTRSLDNRERLRAQNLDERRNLVLLIEPRIRASKSDERYDLLADDGLVDLAKRVEACRILLDESGPSAEAASEYRSVQAQTARALEQAVKEHYGVYVDWHEALAAKAPVSDHAYTIHTVENFEAAAFQRYVRTELTSEPDIQAEVAGALDSYKHRKLSTLVQTFDTDPSRPFPFEEGVVERVVYALVRQGKVALQDKAGNQHDRHNVGNLAPEDALGCTLVDHPKTPDKPRQEHWFHPHVTYEVNADKRAPTLRWSYPQHEPGMPPLRTLVARYRSPRQWDVNKVHAVDLDQTRDVNRYDQAGESFTDQGPMEPGLYYYYVFLVHELPDAAPVCALSQRCDIRIAPLKPKVRQGVVVIEPPRAGWQALLAATEARLMSSAKDFNSATRFHRAVFQISGAGDGPHIEGMASGVGELAQSVEVEADVRLTAKGEFTRENVLNLIRRLPRSEALYRAELRLDPDTVTSEGTR